MPDVDVSLIEAGMGAWQGANTNFTDCVYVTDGDYRTHTGRKVAFLIFWTAQWTWLTVFPELFGYCTFGRKSCRWYENVMMLSIQLAVALLTLNGTLVKHRAINASILELYMPGEDFTWRQTWNCGQKHGIQ